MSKLTKEEIKEYKKIDTSKYKKIFVTGDLHGCYEVLFCRLKDVKFNFDEDLLISVGDLIDRGVNSLDCLRLINEKWFFCVRGNHEQMAINTLDGNKQSMYCWMYNGGDWYFSLDAKEKSDANKLIKQCKDLPLIIEAQINSKKWVFAHADYPFNEYEFGKPVSNKQVIWSRERFEKCDNSEIKGADFFVFGHTPQKKITQIANRLYIDTGAVFNGNLIVTRIDNV